MIAAALYVRADSIYRQFDAVDCYDETRDARTFKGPAPVVAHPPCAQWGNLATFAHPDPVAKALAVLAVDQVRQFGGVLEHPATSRLWPELALPEPGRRDRFGGWTLPICQSDFGHRARKKTRLYIVGCEPSALPALPIVLGEPSHVIAGKSGKRKGMPGWKPDVTHREREATPPLLAAWLVEVARRCAMAQ